MINFLKSEVNYQHAGNAQNHLTTGRSQTPTHQKEHRPQETERTMVLEHSVIRAHLLALSPGARQFSTSKGLTDSQKERERTCLRQHGHLVAKLGTEHGLLASIGVSQSFQYILWSLLNTTGIDLSGNWSFLNMTQHNNVTCFFLLRSRKFSSYTRAII